MLKKLINRGGLWVGAQFALFILVAFSGRLLPAGAEWPWPQHQAIGIPIMAAGVVLATAGLAKLGSSLTPLPHPKDNSVLRSDGVYRIVRHPIYGGIVLLVLGYCLYLPSTLELFFAAVTAVFFDRKASLEEGWLRARYADYSTYAQKTKKLIPWIY